MFKNSRLFTFTKLSNINLLPKNNSHKVLEIWSKANIIIRKEDKEKKNTVLQANMSKLKNSKLQTVND